MHAELLGAGTHKHGNEQALGDGLGEQALDLFLGERFAVEVLHHKVVIGLGHGFAELLAGGLGGLAVLLGDVEFLLRGAFAVAGLHAHDVDDALEAIARTPRQRHGAQAHAEALAQGLHAGIVVRVFLVDAIDEHRTRQAQVLGGVPELDRGGLRSLRGVDHEERGLAHAHGRVSVADKVGVARRVQHIDADVFPVNRRNGGRN